MAAIVLKTGESVLLDDEDYARIGWRCWRLKKSNKGGTYAVATAYENGRCRMISMHREIMNPPAEVALDHINGDTLDNRKSNLRAATNSQNQQNRHKARGRSQYKGVGWHEQAGKWQVQIKLNGKSRYVGIYANEIVAAKAYDRAARKLFGPYARLNFSKEAA